MADRAAARRHRGHALLLLMPLVVVCALLCLPGALASRAPLSLQQQEQQAEATANATTGSSSKDDFDFFFLVRQYPPTFCNDHRCVHSPPRKFAFTIHGLWPQRADGSWPEFCAGPDGGPGGGLSLWRLRDLLPAMAKAWPSWTAGNRAFWQHEWARHGACAAPALAPRGSPPPPPGRGQHAFFATVLELHGKYRVEEALEAAGIEPSAEKRYAAADVVEAVDRAHGVRPHVTCDFHGNLAEVWYCVAKDGKGAVDCGPDSSAALEAAQARRAAAAAAPGPAAAALRTSNTYCRTVALPPPRARGAGEAIADEAPIVTLAGIVVSAAVAAVRGGQWWASLPRAALGGGSLRPLLSAS